MQYLKTITAQILAAIAVSTATTVEINVNNGALEVGKSTIWRIKSIDYGCSHDFTNDIK